MSLIKKIHDIVEFLKITLAQSGTNGYVLGISGGVDSAVCAALAKIAVDELNATDTWYDTRNDYHLDLYILPMGNQASDATVAQEVAAKLGIVPKTIELGSALGEFVKATHVDGEADQVKVLGNVKARLRMTTLYYFANRDNLLVLGTDNKTETYTGYFTKHGDGAADVFPISAFNKREVYELATALNLPASVINRAPSAGLWEGQTDEGEMGVPYDFIDNCLEGLYDLNDRVYGETGLDYRLKLAKLHNSTQHKRNPPHVFELSTNN